MEERYGRLIFEAQSEVFKSMLQLKNRRSIRYFEIKESRFPVVTYTGTFDLQEDDSRVLEEWLKGIVSNWHNEIVLLFRDGAHADIVWRGGDSEVRLVRRTIDDFRQDLNHVGLAASRLCR